MVKNVRLRQFNKFSSGSVFLNRKEKRRLSHFCPVEQWMDPLFHTTSLAIGQYRTGVLLHYTV